MEKLEENGRNMKRKIAQSIERLISELQSRKKCLMEEVDVLVAMESSHKHKVRQTITFTTGDENVLLSAIRNFGVVSAHLKLTLGGDLAPEGVSSGTTCGPRASGCATLVGGENANLKFTKSSVSVVAGDQFNVVYNITGSEGKASPANQAKQIRSKQQLAEESDAAEALQRYRNKGKVKKYFGTKGNDVGQMNHSHGISSTPSDDIVVADTNNHRIQIFDVNGQVKGVFGSYGMSEGQFDIVTDVCVTSRGRIVASDYGNNRIQIFDEQGRFVQEFGRKGSGDGELNRPSGVATDDKGLIYVCDWNNYRVQVFSEKGKFVRKFGSVEKRFQKPSYLSVTSNGRVVISDCAIHRVVVCDSYGRHLVKVGMDESQFKNPRGVATDDHGNIIVCDCDNNRVQVFASDGEIVSCFGSEGSEPGEMKKPVGVCVLSDGGIAVSDWGNDRVQIF